MMSFSMLLNFVDRGFVSALSHGFKVTIVGVSIYFTLCLNVV